MELSDEQIERVDAVYNAVIDVCKFLTDDGFDEGDTQTYCSIAEMLADELTIAGYKVHFPAHIWDQDGERIVDIHHVTIYE